MVSLFKQINIQMGFLALVGLMLVTRVHHFGSAFSLPDASLAVFFLAGCYFKRLSLFLFLLMETAAVDYLAIDQFNVSDWCVSPAYAGLIPTYALMYFAGHYSAEFSFNNSKAVATQFALLFLATSGAFLISNGTFYLFSGRSAQMAVSIYSEKVMQYYLSYLTATLIYGIVIVAGIKLVQALSQYQAVSKHTVH